MIHEPFLAALLLGIVPSLALAWRWREHARRRRWLVGFSGLLAGLALPYHGIDFEDVKRINMLLVVATTLWLLAERSAAGRQVPKGLRRALLPVLAALAVVNFLNYFAFHGEQVFVHWHDVEHYYLGSKYHSELGYTELYTAMLRAEAEATGDRFKALEARDLRNYDLVDIRVLLRRSDEVKERFSPRRWVEFVREAALFRDELGPHYAGVLKDHGYNPTPVWTTIGGTLANLVPPASRTGITLLTLLDPLLLLVTFAAIGRSFGKRAMWLSIIYFCTLFGPTFGWVGGAFLRYTWLAATLGSAAAMRRRRYGLAGALLGAATALRIFPVTFAVPLACKALWAWRRLGGPPRRYLRFGLAFAAAVILLFAASSLRYGLDDWTAFRANLDNQVDNIAPNTIGLTKILFQPRAPAEVTLEEFNQLKDLRRNLRHWQLLLALPLTLAFVAWRSPPLRDVACLGLGALPVFVTSDAGAYYYSFLLLLVLANAKRPGRLAAIFAVEVATYVLMLFLGETARLYVWRSVLVLYLILYLYWPPRWAGKRSSKNARVSMEPASSET